MPRIDHCDAHGSEIGTLCVTTAIPWTSAVPTISASGIGRGSGIWSCADRFATAVSTAGIRFANAVNTRSFIPVPQHGPTRGIAALDPQYADFQFDDRDDRNEEVGRIDAVGPG